MAEDKALIADIIESINKAWLEGRYGDIAGHLHEAVVLSPPGADPVTGREAVVQGYADFGSAATIHAFESQEPRIDCWGSTAVAESPFVIDYEIPSGRFKERGVDLLVFTRTGAAWQVCWRTLTSTPAESSSRQTSMKTENVDTFLASLDHPFKQEILAIREVILGADPGISEGIKWNAPSFRTTEHFATLNLRAKDGVLVILHFGAKKRARPISRAAISDPESLIEWLGEDRASAKFRDMEDIHARRSAFVNVIRQWIQHV